MKKLKVYKIQNAMIDYSFFIENNNKGYMDLIQYKAMHNQSWEKFDLTKYEIPRFELCSSDTGKKNYKFDVSSASAPFYIFSEKAVESLKDILEPRGQFLPIITPSKRKKYIGYYPIKPLINGVDLEKSEQMSEDPMKNFGVTDISKLHIKKDVILDDYIICPELGKSCVLVTEKFRKRVEEAGLEGFDFIYSDYEITLL